jgi:polyribonucleotide nucleotidyltransferase
MASVCGGTLSLLDAGVPMKRPVAGIAMGLITEENEEAVRNGTARYAVLSDILGDEDHLGDMDFKVAGTEDGITGFQMDIKIAGVSVEIMRKALEQAKAGRMHILGIMNGCIDKPAAEISELAPKIVSMKIDTDKIGALIGPGGKVVKALCEQYHVKIDTAEDGTVTIYGKTAKDSEDAREAVKGITENPEVGRIYNGTVKRIMEFGAFVEILPGKEGLCHISQLSRQRVNRVEDVVHEGDEIPVKLLEVDKLGRLNLSYIEAIDPDGASKTEGENGEGGGSNGGGHYGRSGGSYRNNGGGHRYEGGDRPPRGNDRPYGNSDRPRGGGDRNGGRRW